MKKSFCVLLSAFLTTSILLTGCQKPGRVSVPEPYETPPVEPVKYDYTGKYLLDDDTLEAVINDVSFESQVLVPSEDNHRVFYQIFVGSFSDSDGDGTGDLRGIINRMDYLNDGDITSGKSLGIEGIWLSPINASGSYHKYDVQDYYAIDESFGTMDDLKELVSLAHERGIKVILDLVINHSSSRNDWFVKFRKAHIDGDTESEYYDFYSWSEQPVPGRTFSKLQSTDVYYECNFDAGMPELNYDNEAVRNEMLNVAKYYLTEVGVDGFRFDAAKYIYFKDDAKSAEFWKWYMDELKKIKPDIYAVAEVWDSDSITDKYEPALNCFNFSMSQASGKIATAAMKGDVNGYVAYVDRYIDKVTSLNEDAMIIPFLANHDMDRAAGFMQFLTGYGNMAANLYILGPGSPFIYYGEEIGMKGSRGGANTDANRRLAMRWGDRDTVKSPEGSDYEDKLQTNGNLSDQFSNGSSVYNYYKRLIMIRRANPEIALGDYVALKFNETKVSGFVSTYEGASVCVIHNTTGKAVTVDLKDATAVEFKKINAAIGVSTDEATLEGTVLTVPSQTSVVLR